jgi:beta-carotene 15,15'-dioxygenase
MKVIEVLGKGLGLLVGLVYLFVIEENNLFLWAWFTGVMITVGIPHGAIDHLLYYQKKGSESSLSTFIFLYVSIMATYLICWYYLPIPALILFLTMSAYHFGQSHFIHIKVEKQKVLLYMATGFYYLGVILFSDFDNTGDILKSMVDIQLLRPFTTAIVLGLMLLSASLFLFQAPSKKYIFLLELPVLGLILYYLPLLLAFITYFGFWHSLPSLLEEYKNLRLFGSKNKVTSFVKNLLPFSLISMLGIILILLVVNRWLAEEELILTFFVLVSLISAPHIWIMNRFLETD